MKKNLTELVFILDKSGSMCGLEGDVVGGYNALLKENREMEGEAIVSTVLFDGTVKVVHDRVDVDEVEPLGMREYRPGGCTALLDAVGGAIHHMETVFKILPDECRPEHVLFAITTDGLENASTEYSYPRVKRMIGTARERGWEFLFLGANIDVAAEAGRLGISPECAACYEATPDGMALAFSEIQEASARVRGGRGIRSRRHPAYSSQS